MLRVLVVTLALLCADVNGQATLTLPEGETFNVKDFGAKGDGKTLDWLAILDTFAAAKKAEGGTVYFPSGSFLTGPFNLTSNTNVVLGTDAVILASSDASLYNTATSIVAGFDITNVQISGGVIDGQGPNWWPNVPTMVSFDKMQRLGKYPPPFLFECHGCSHVVVRDIQLKNSPFWTMHPYNCSYWTISRINIYAPINSPNTDCIDPDSSNNFLIEDSVLACGDDHVSVKANPGHPPSFNMLIRNTTFLHGQGMTIGSAIGGGVRNITFRDSTMIGGLVGMRFKAVRNRGGVAEQIYFENLSFQSVAILFSINMDFDHDPAPTNATLSPIVRDVHFKDISGWGVVSWLLHCLPESPCTGFDLQGVNTVICQNMECSHVSGTWSNCSHPVPCTSLHHLDESDVVVQE
mmetsp:Transcript_4190/g.9084  ORF Transcript_4190/g.9084 Transcript_4190/m.9084 type:complete len:407 (-) Transcript_4190:29-1249(-)